MQLLSNISKIVKPTQAEAKQPTSLALDPLTSTPDAPLESASEDVVPQPARRRTLSGGKRQSETTEASSSASASRVPPPPPRKRRRTEAAIPASSQPSAPVGTSTITGDEEEAIARFLDDAADDSTLTLTEQVAPEPEPLQTPAPAPKPAPAAKQTPPSQTEEPAPSIWSGTGDDQPSEAVQVVPAPSRKKRPARVKTRLLNFDDAPEMPKAVLEESVPAAVSPSVKFPVGWLLVMEGPGRGECFTLRSGVSRIGRDADETVPLNFGDLSISRSNHASIAYDTEDHQFYIGQSGKSNIVRLNGKPLLSTEQVSDGDIIRIGETSLRLVVLCNDDFNWNSETQVDEALLNG